MPAVFRKRSLVLRSLAYHYRSHLGTALGAAVACAVLAGAFVVGDSVRESLRTLALERLGRVDFTLVAERPFRAALAGAFQSGGEAAVGPRGKLAAAPALLLRGSASFQSESGQE